MSLSTRGVRRERHRVCRAGAHAIGMTRAPILAAAIASTWCGGSTYSPTVTPTPVLCTPPARPSNHVPQPPGQLPCPTAAELASLQADVHFSFEGATGEGALVCTSDSGSQDLTRYQERAYQALLWMKRSRFDRPLPWTNQSLYDWFRSTVAGVRFRSDVRMSFCCEPAGVVNLTNGGLDFEECTIPGYPLEVMIHEARHIEFGPHRCSSFDINIAEMGAYGVQYSLMLWIGRHHLTATTAEREWALNRAAWLRHVAFCNECD